LHLNSTAPGRFNRRNRNHCRSYRAPAGALQGVDAPPKVAALGPEFLHATADSG
jgi:hypothetical protein